jgi:hypothetical protein
MLRFACVNEIPLYHRNPMADGKRWRRTVNWPTAAVDSVVDRSQKTHLKVSLLVAGSLSRRPGEALTSDSTQRVTFSCFELYDLSTDIEQKKDISLKHPELFARLRKQLLDINASVIADAPNWTKSSEGSE